MSAPITDLECVLTVEEGAEFLRVGRNALYDAIGRGEVPHRRIGRTIRLSRAVLIRWLEGDDSRSTAAVRSGDTLRRSCGASSTQGQR